MRRGLICLLLLLIAAISVPAYAMTVTFNSSVPSSWPTDANGAVLAYQTEALSFFTVNENNAGGYANGNLQGLGQMFAATTDMKVKTILIYTGGLPAGDYTFAAYDLGPASNFTRVQPDPCDLSTVTPAFSSPFTTAGSVAALATFALGSSEIFDVNSGDKYAFVVTETISNGLGWMRGAAGTIDGMGITTNGGGAGLNIWKNIRDYGGAPTTDTTNVRQMSLAIYSVMQPAKASSPTPADAGTGMSTISTLSWSSDANAASHDVYFGTDFNEVNDADDSDPNVFQGNQTDTSFDPGPLLTSTTYYWRIDEKNDLYTTTGDVWSFTTAEVRPLTITKCKVKAGKTQGADSGDINNIKDYIQLVGTADFPDDANQITQLDINIISVDDNEIVYNQTITDINGYVNSIGTKISYSHKIPKYTLGEITSLKMDFVKNTFSLTAKNVDLTGLGCNVKLELIMNEIDTTLSGEANEAIVNGRKLIPTRLMRMYQDTLIVTRAKAKHSTKALSDSLSVKGEIAVEDINNTDMNEPNLAAMDVNFVWGDQVFSVLTGDFVAAKTGHKYTCKNIQSDVNEGLVTAKFDLDRCTFTLSVKEVNNLYALPDYPDVDFSINYGIGDANDFNEPADVNLVTRRSY